MPLLRSLTVADCRAWTSTASMSWRPRSPASAVRAPGGAARWQVHGRLVARELDASHVAVRVPFDVRDLLLHHHPRVFAVPPRFAKHMMVVADLRAGDDAAVEEAVTAAWRLQTGADPDSDGTDESGDQERDVG